MTEKKEKDLKDVVEKKVVVIKAYMAEEEQQQAVEFARASLVQKEQATERDISQYIKKEADKVMGPGRWHCIYGRSFGSFVTYEAMKMVHFTIGQHHILLWKHG
eukprot:TRINITY_DN67959_c0_g1_i1.p1 TRINITY_DN67959_c0_g1~~TRINITY_DN67959_c0_g1_i1.p1  ORF type:complete len:104 (+),score=53.30 TRINITY_DN67959_c0_g1_i1:293-604(+)